MKKLGNVLIILAIIILGYIYFPIIYLYFPQDSQISEVKASNFNINIPKIKAYAKVVEDVDPWNESEYQEKLKQGVAQAKGFAKPGEKGVIFLFAHSFDEPWNMTRYNIPFFRLGELNLGDEILINKDGTEFKYKVSEKKEVWPQEVDQLKIEGDKLILQTCTPIGTTFKRLLIYADPV